MKKFVLAALVFFSLAAQAQKTGAKKTVVKNPATPPAIVLKNLTDSVSYAIGLNVAKFYAQQGVHNINPALIARAVSDVYGQKKELLTEDDANMALMRLLNPELFKNIETGEKFLAENKNVPGVKTTASGLQYQVLTLGAGAKPQATDTVEVHYVGKLLNGTEFDNSYKRGAATTFPLNAVIPGWTEGLQLMPVGSKYRLFIPYQLAYGMNDSGPIPGGSVLIFDVELLGIQGK